VDLRRVEENSAVPILVIFRRILFGVFEISFSELWLFVDIFIVLRIRILFTVFFNFSMGLSGCGKGSSV
jgi:hypothetical protein